MPANLNKDAQDDSRRALVAMGWKKGNYNGKYNFDIDVSAFLLTEDGRVKEDADFVFYGNATSGNGAVIHTGDNASGNEGGDCEAVFINFDKVPDYVERIAIAVTIYNADVRRQSFGNLENVYVRVADCSAPQDTMFLYDFTGRHNNDNVVIACEFVRKRADWRFRAVGTGFRGSLLGVCVGYGVNAYV